MRGMSLFVDKKLLQDGSHWYHKKYLRFLSTVVSCELFRRSYGQLRTTYKCIQCMWLFSTLIDAVNVRQAEWSKCKKRPKVTTRILQHMAWTHQKTKQAMLLKVQLKGGVFCIVLILLGLKLGVITWLLSPGISQQVQQATEPMRILGKSQDGILQLWEKQIAKIGEFWISDNCCQEQLSNNKRVFQDGHCKYGKNHSPDTDTASLHYRGPKFFW